MNTKRYIDLFSGCGGLSLGFYNSKLWKGLFAVEKDPMAFSTLSHNLIEKNNHFLWPEWLENKSHDIKEVLESKEAHLNDLAGTVDLVAGGPPCQGFSMAGRRVISDQRNTLVQSYIDFIRIVQPKAIFFENVEGFTLPFNKDGEKKFSVEVDTMLKEAGYTTSSKIVNFSDFGVPQRRKRYIIVGFKKDPGVDFFEFLEKQRPEFLKSKGLAQTTPIKEAISDLERSNGSFELPQDKFSYGMYGESDSNYQSYMRSDNIELPDSHRFANHTPVVEERMREVIRLNLKTSKEVRDKFKLKKSSIKLLQADQSSPTLTTLPDDYIHYNEPRILTVREYARIQSFKDWFEFKGKYTTGGERRIQEVPRYSQIGNAIPPLFAEQCAFAIAKLIQ